MSNSLDLHSIRPLRRSDLEVVCRNQGDATTDEEWVVKDPIQLNYFYLDRVQHWLFDKLDGSRSLKEIQHTFSQEFSGAKISEQQLLNFCLRLGKDGLLCEAVSGERLLQRKKQQRRTPIHKLPLSLLAIRLPGVNAGTAISIADSLFGWLFKPWAVLLVLVWLTFAFCVGIQSLDEIVWALPTLSNVRFADIALLLFCVSTVKIIHELAHAVCCRRMGAACNEIGLMLLVFSPCLYCNVTDSWMLPSKWKRIAVAAAGIYVELLIASCSFFLWCYAETAFLKSIFLNLMIVCSVSTLFVNGNPLMRYDGYFILLDIVGVPNLSQQARMKAWDLFTKPFFVSRQSIGNQNRTNKAVFLVSYHFASVAYRLIVLTVIFFVFTAVLKPFGLQNVAISLAVVYAACLLFAFVVSLIPMLTSKSRKGRRNWAGIFATLLFVSGLGYCFVSVQVPHSMSTAARIEFNELASCTANIGGKLEWTVSKEARIRKGDTIATLANADLELERTRLNHQIELAKLKLENLKSRSGNDPESRIALPSAESELAALNDELTMLDQRLGDLEITAPVSGIIVESFKQPESRNPIQMTSWSGSALSPHNRGCSIQQGETICMIGKRNDWKVVLLINEQKRDLVSGGEKVNLRTSLERDRIYSATIGKIFSDEMKSEISGQRQFRAELLLDEPLSVGFHGAAGKAKVIFAEQTLWETCRRYVIESFQFD